MTAAEGPTMSEHHLTGMRILVVEDEVLIADDLVDTLAAEGAEVLGPAVTVRQAMVQVETEAWIDAAVLDINLRGEMIYPVAERLVARGVPIVFASGYDQFVIPERFAGIPHVEKPVRFEELRHALHRGAAPSA